MISKCKNTIFAVSGKSELFSRVVTWLDNNRLEDAINHLDMTQLEETMNHRTNLLDNQLELAMNHRTDLLDNQLELAMNHRTETIRDHVKNNKHEKSYCI